MKEKVCVVGLGYIGLPTASLLADRGYNVHGVDIREDVVDALNKGEVLILEPGLNKFVREASASGNLKASTKPDRADIFILALPTPFTEGQKPDLSFVRDGVQKIAPFIQPGNMVILESTSPVGTTEMIADLLHERRPDLNIPGHEGGKGEQLYIAHCPERVLPGKILDEIVNNDRIIGGIDDNSTRKVADFYRNFVNGSVLETSARSAELSKLVENSYRDVNIAFANELSLICDKLGVDVWEVIELANHHPRVNILKPGAGVGGHCISVDPWFIVDAAPTLSRLIRTARETNNYKSDWVYERIAGKAQKLPHPVIACLGLAYKPDIDDLRESPAVHIVKRLAENRNWQILVVEPFITALPAALAKYDNIKKCDLAEALTAANLVALLTGHTQFRTMADMDLAGKTVMDACGLFKK